jgi:hypothetical protein
MKPGTSPAATVVFDALAARANKTNATITIVTARFGTSAHSPHIRLVM